MMFSYHGAQLIRCTKNINPNRLKCLSRHFNSDKFYIYAAKINFNFKEGLYDEKSPNYTRDD